MPEKNIHKCSIFQIHYQTKALTHAGYTSAN